MKKELMIQIVVMIAALAAASLLALKLTPMQREISSEKSMITKAPLGGNEKITADVQWMRFINLLGGYATVDESNTKEVESKLEELIRLDPNFDLLYKEGVMNISKSNPKKAVALLSKACTVPHLKNNWQIPFYAGFIYMRDSLDINDQSKILMKADYQKASDFFKMAIERSETPENYIINNYIRAQTKAIASHSRLADRDTHAKLKVLYSEYAGQNAQNATGTHTTLIPDVQQRLLAAIQDAKNPTDEDGKAIQVSPETLKLIDQVQKAVFAGRNLCSDCLFPSQPGDKFCTNCGKKLQEVWGTCSKCGTVLHSGAKFCHTCGTAAEAEKK